MNPSFFILQRKSKLVKKYSNMKRVMCSVNVLDEWMLDWTARKPQDNTPGEIISWSKAVPDGMANTSQKSALLLILKNN